MQKHFCSPSRAAHASQPTTQSSNMKTRSLHDVLKQVGETADFYGIEVNQATDRGLFGNTPLHAVAVWGDVQAAEVLLRNGADPNAAGEDGYTPLHEAVEQGHHDLCNILLQNGALVHARNRDGATAADIAAVNNDPAMIKLLSEFVAKLKS